jgi:triosephosphate isomerase
MRKKIIAGNWKMNKSFQEATAFMENLKSKLLEMDAPKNTIIIFPPFPYINALSIAGKGVPNLFTGAQNCASEAQGAYTGEVSASMIKSVGGEYVIIGHSERRAYFNESSALLSKKLDLALKNELTTIYCVGEPLEIRKSNTYLSYIETQLKEGLGDFDGNSVEKMIIAYEPVWAIGTGLNATPEQAQEVHHFIRKSLVTIFGVDIAMNIPILYGGSCNPANAASLFSCPDVDGGLIGGASLKVDDFLKLIELLQE